MPTEVRHILFRASEVVVAIADYSRRMHEPLPTGSVVDCAIRTDETGGEVTYSLSIEGDSAERAGAPSRREVTMQGPALAAALILYCRDRRIPLPIDAQKSLQRFGEVLALVVTRNPRKEVVPDLARGKSVRSSSRVPAASGPS